MTAFALVAVTPASADPSVVTGRFTRDTPLFASVLDQGLCGIGSLVCPAPLPERAARGNPAIIACQRGGQFHLLGFYDPQVDSEVSAWTPTDAVTPSGPVRTCTLGEF